MKLSLNWLKEFIEVKETPEKLAEILTLAGIEVEHITHLGKGLEGIVVGQIKTIVKHPAADKLQLTKVDIGKGKTLDIVCGAFNIRVGHKVPVAPVGTTLPNGMKIERRPIRGVDSNGMLCAEDELGLGKDHTGIVILPESAKIGTPFTFAYGIDDVVLDLSLTPQRADLFSVYGIARELSALTGRAVKPLKLKELPPSRRTCTVLIERAKLCPSYGAVLVSGIRKTETPQWMKVRLIGAGMRPINLIVDVTNYVMLEVGQPLHAFDRAKLSHGKRITLGVRVAKVGERMTTLDGKNRELEPSMLVITDGKHSLAIAGVMGGEATEVSTSTVESVIESAIFDPVSIRKTSMKLGLRSEASTRFEKGISPSLPKIAMMRVAQLLTDIAGARVTDQTLVGGATRPRQPVVVMAEKINSLLGTSLSASVIQKYLMRLGCGVRISKNGLNVIPPEWRLDLSIPAELAEEIGRLHGLNTLIPTHFVRPSSAPSVDPRWSFAQHAKDVLAGLGCVEAYTYSFYGQQVMRPLHLVPDEHFEVSNPLNPDQQFLRTTLLPNLFEAGARNAQTEEAFDLFEIGTVFHPSTSDLPQEERKVALCAFGRTSRFYHLKGVLESFLAALGIVMDHVSYAPVNTRYADAAAHIFVNKTSIGTIGELSTESERGYKIRGETSYAEISLDALMPLSITRKAFTDIPAYPAVMRDISFVVDHTVTYGQVYARIRDVDKLISHVRGFDTVPFEERKSMAVHIIFQSPERTLTSQEVDRTLEKICQILERELGAKIRKADS